MESGVDYSVEGSSAIVRLDRPQRLNAFTLRMVGEIRAAVDTAVRDETVVGIILTGTGRGFCAGLDSEDLMASASGRTPGGGEARGDELPALFSFLLQAPKPVIAAVNGVCAGGGFVLAMLADLRFAAPEAAFVTAFAQRGLIAEHGTSWFLPRMVGTSRALDLLWSSRRVDAEEALRIGLVDRIVRADRLLDEARDYVDQLAAKVAPRSVAAMKSQVYRGL